MPKRWVQLRDRAARTGRLALGGAIVAGAVGFQHPHLGSEALTAVGDIAAFPARIAGIAPEPLRTLADLGACRAQGAVGQLSQWAGATEYRSEVPSICTTATPQQLAQVTEATGAQLAIGTSALLLATLLTRGALALRNRRGVSPKIPQGAVPVIAPPRPGIQRLDVVPQRAANPTTRR